MKKRTKLASVLLALALCLTLLPISALAAGETYSLALTANGVSSATVAPGGSVTIRLALTNTGINDDENYDLYAVQDYITFDTAYFTVDPSSIETMKLSSGAELFHASAVHFSGSENDRVFVNRASTSAQSVAKTIQLVSFTLNVKSGATSGTTTIGHDTVEVLTGTGSKLRNTSENATVTIDAGTPPTPDSPSGGGGGGGASAPAAGSVPVVVDGVSHNIGSVSVDTKTDTTSVTEDHAQLAAQIESANQYVRVPISAATATAEAQFAVADVETMQTHGMTLIVDLGDVQYSIPTSAVNTAALSKEFPGVSTGSIPFVVAVADTPATKNTAAKQAVEKADGELVLPAIDFTVTAEYGGKSVEVEVFERYTARIVEVTAEQARRITTAVVYEADGSLRHVPTQVYQSGGRWYAKINSLTNSTYALIYHEASLSDTAGKWYGTVVDEMVSRKIINGYSDGTYKGASAVTRAEFAAIIVRALGLPAGGTAGFSDTPSGAWYNGAVGTAVQYGIVTGYTNGTFQPYKNITRQEAMAMVARAAKAAELTGVSGGDLSGFQDANDVGAWAKTAVELNVANGLIRGNGGYLKLNDSITRAETAVVVLRLLQKAGLVDVRATA